MTFESFEAAQREAAYLKCKTCAESSKVNVACGSCKLYDICGKGTMVVMDDPLSLIELVTGEKCEIVKPVSEMEKELNDYCNSESQTYCNNCIFNNIEYSDGRCLVSDCEKSDGLVELLYDYYENHMNTTKKQ